MQRAEMFLANGSRHYMCAVQVFIRFYNFQMFVLHILEYIPYIGLLDLDLTSPTINIR